MPRKIEISHRTLMVTSILVFLVWLVTKIWQVIIIVFISFIIMSAVKPIVDSLERFRLPRSLSIVLVYALLWLMLGGLLAAIIPPLIVQTKRLVLTLPVSLENVQYLNTHQQEITGQILSSIGSLPEKVFSITSGVFSNVLNIITTIIISFYLILERKHMDRYLETLFGSRTGPVVSKLVSRVESKLGDWVRGELILMTAVGIATYFGLKLLGVETAIPLAILAGMLEIIPSLGPVISAIPAIIVSLLVHPLLALSTTALYVLVQLLENNFLVPQVMRKATGVHPLVSLLSLMIGFELAGAAGAILAIPAVLTLQTIGFHFFSLSHLEDISDTD
jgi:predicted PurR-regulated permease PerM